jgi:hypothetical protein
VPAAVAASSSAAIDLTGDEELAAQLQAEWNAEMSENMAPAAPASFDAAAAVDSHGGGDSAMAADRRSSQEDADALLARQLAGESDLVSSLNYSATHLASLSATRALEARAESALTEGPSYRQQLRNAAASKKKKGAPFSKPTQTADQAALSRADRAAHRHAERELALRREEGRMRDVGSAASGRSGNQWAALGNHIETSEDDASSQSSDDEKEETTAEGEKGQVSAASKAAADSSAAAAASAAIAAAAVVSPATEVIVAGAAVAAPGVHRIQRKGTLAALASASSSPQRTSIASFPLPGIAALSSPSSSSSFSFPPPILPLIDAAAPALPALATTAIPSPSTSAIAKFAAAAAAPSTEPATEMTLEYLSPQGAKAEVGRLKETSIGDHEMTAAAAAGQSASPVAAVASAPAATVVASSSTAAVLVAAAAAAVPTAMPSASSLLMLGPAPSAPSSSSKSTSASLEAAEVLSSGSDNDDDDDDEDEGDDSDIEIVSFVTKPMSARATPTAAAGTAAAAAAAATTAAAASKGQMQASSSVSTVWQTTGLPSGAPAATFTQRPNFYAPSAGSPVEGFMPLGGSGAPGKPVKSSQLKGQLRAAKKAKAKAAAAAAAAAAAGSSAMEDEEDRYVSPPPSPESARARALYGAPPDPAALLPSAAAGAAGFAGQKRSWAAAVGSAAATKAAQPSTKKQKKAERRRLQLLQQQNRLMEQQLGVGSAAAVAAAGGGGGGALSGAHGLVDRNAKYYSKHQKPLPVPDSSSLPFSLSTHFAPSDLWSLDSDWSQVRHVILLDLDNWVGFFRRLPWCFNDDVYLWSGRSNSDNLASRILPAVRVVVWPPLPHLRSANDFGISVVLLILSPLLSGYSMARTPLLASNSIVPLFCTFVPRSTSSSHVAASDLTRRILHCASRSENSTSCARRTFRSRCSRAIEVSGAVECACTSAFGLVPLPLLTGLPPCPFSSAFLSSFLSFLFRFRRDVDSHSRPSCAAHRSPPFGHQRRDICTAQKHRGHMRGGTW